MSNTTKVYGTNAATLLGVAFIVLKLTGVINWSWWWVTSPFWIPWLLAIVLIIVLATIKCFKEDQYGLFRCI